MKYYVYGTKIVCSILSVNSFTGILDKTGKFLTKTGGLAYESDAKSHPNEYFCSVFNWKSK
jgi:hypothetical protein